MNVKVHTTPRMGGIAKGYYDLACCGHAIMKGLLIHGASCPDLVRAMEGASAIGWRTQPPSLEV